MASLFGYAIGAILFLWFGLDTTPGKAGNISAIVEDAPSHTGLAMMDFLEPGRVVRLRDNEQITLGYLAGCVRETITGGTITIGAEQSEVTGGTVVRDKVDCTGSSMQLSQEQAQQSGVMITRGLPKRTTVYGLQPVFFLHSLGLLTITRIDKGSSVITIDVPKTKVVDLADANISLAAGGTYQAEVDGKRLKFAVFRKAKPGKISLLSRLLMF